MTAYLVSDVCDDARLYLNDTAAQLFTNTILIPFVKRAYDEMQLFIEIDQIPVGYEIAAKTVTAGLVVKTPADFSLTDVLVPEYLEERLSGSSDPYSPMNRRSPLPQRNQSGSLDDWDWREEAFQFVGATTDRQINIHYWKSLAALSVAGDTVPIANARQHLGYRVAALAAMFNAENPTRAIALNNEADKFLDAARRISVLNSQNILTRRRPYRSPGKLGTY